MRRPPCLEPLHAIERASLDELQSLQLDRLQGTLHHAYEHSPVYRARFDADGVHPEDLKSSMTWPVFPRPARPTCATTIRSACSPYPWIR